MKGRAKRIASIVVVIAVLIAIALWWRAKPVPPAAEPAHRSSPATTAMPPQSPSPKASASTPEAALAAAKDAEEKRGRELQRTFQTLNDNPIEFYGRVLDQSGVPVAGADVTGIVLYDTGGKSGQRRAQTVTDAQGGFQFTELRGESIGIDIAKGGYEYVPFKSAYSYTPTSRLTISGTSPTRRIPSSSRSGKNRGLKLSSITTRCGGSPSALARSESIW